MSTPIKHVAYLSQEIGPRPSGTEEEQQAALYITKHLQKDAHLTASIEDFNCTTNPDLPKIVCYIIAILMLALSLVLPVASVPAAVLSAITAAILILETCDKPIVSQFLPVGISQNVIGKYEPVHNSENDNARRRKVIIVAHYDSGKVRHDLARPLVGIRHLVDKVILAASVATPVFLLIWGIAFNGVEEQIATVGTIIKVVLAVIMVIPVVFFIMEKLSAYNEAANCNASGVAVMLEVARRLGNGEVSDSPISMSGVMHDEQAAYEAGVVPDGATIHYEDRDSAKAPESTTEDLQTRHRVHDIADNLVQVKDAPIPSPDEESLSKARQDTRAALSSAPAGTLAEAAAKAAALQEQAEQGAAEEAAAQVRYEKTTQEAEVQVQAAAEIALQEQSSQIQAKQTTGVPDWYKKATEKARLKAEHTDEKNDAAQYRSHYADFPQDDSKNNDSEVKDTNTSTSDIPLIENDSVARETSPSFKEADFNTDDHFDGSEVVLIEGDAPRVVDGVSEENGTIAIDNQQDVLAAQNATASSIVYDDKSPVEPQPDKEQYSATETPMQNPSLSPDQPGSTTAMPPLVGSGNLNLDALREIAKNVSSDGAQDNNSLEVATASTTRLPQMMYYTPPAERPEEMHTRAQKDRVTVSTEGVEQAAVMDAVENTSHEPQYNPSSLQSHITKDASLQSKGQSPEDQENDKVQANPSAQRVISPNIPVVDLPEITLPPIMESPDLQPVSFEDFRQRAPLADVAESHNKDAAKSLLATTLPKIETQEADADATVSMPATSNKSQNVSVTGSFAAVEAIGSQPVGDELIAGIDVDDLYIDDADDSVFEEEFTETGAFAGPGYVEMPQSRVGKFFGRFRRKKKSDDKTTQEWLGVDKDFDARSVGKARGSWESFREDDEDWNGGAFSFRRARADHTADVRVDNSASEQETSETHGDGFLDNVANVSADEFAAVAAMAASKAEAAGDTSAENEVGDAQYIYSFAAGDIDTEVWFVALGSELANHGGIRAFLADHASDMRGALIVNLEALGAGELCYLEREGAFKQVGCSPRMKRFIRKASQASGIDMPGAKVSWRDTPASFAMKHRAQAVTIAGMDGKKPALYGEANDVIENIDEKALNRAADFVVDLLKSI